MAGSNFTNGSLVMRVWAFDGSGEMVAKFQYFDDALSFAESKAAKIPASKNEAGADYFYLAVCDHENSFRCFFRPKQVAEAS